MPAEIPDLPAAESAIVAKTNAVRAENELSLLVPDAKLSAAARSYAALLARTGAFAHDADGRQPTDRATAAGYAWCEVAENIGLRRDRAGLTATELAERAVASWMGSAPHRRNLLARGAVDVGVGIAKAPAGDPTYISVQIIARPKSAEGVLRIANTSRARVTYSFEGRRHEVRPRFTVTHRSCGATALSFESATEGGEMRTLARRYEPAGGQAYTLKDDEAGGIRIEIDALGAGR